MSKTRLSSEKLGLGDLSIAIAKKSVAKAISAGRTQLGTLAELHPWFLDLLCGKIENLTQMKAAIRDPKTAGQSLAATLGSCWLLPLSSGLAQSHLSSWVLTTHESPGAMKFIDALKTNWWDNNLPPLFIRGEAKIVTAPAKKPAELSRSWKNVMGSSSGTSSISSDEWEMIDRAIQTLKEEKLLLYATADGNTGARRRGSGFGASAIFCGGSGVLYANRPSISSSIDLLKQTQSAMFPGIPTDTGLGLFAAQIGPESRGALNVARLELKLLVRLIRRMPSQAARIQAVSDPGWVLDNCASFGLAQVIPFASGQKARESLKDLSPTPLNNNPTISALFRSPSLSALYSLGIFIRKLDSFKGPYFFAFYAGDQGLADTLKKATSVGELLIFQRQSHYYRSWALKLDSFLRS